jgi:hypothetical protein
VGRGNAIPSLDWKGEAVVEADDGEPGSRRRSGEQWRTEQGELDGKEVCKCQSVCQRS